MFYVSKEPAVIATKQGWLRAEGEAPLSIIEAFYPGLSGGQALAEGIFGDMNQWGRLPCEPPARFRCLFSFSLIH